jgi:CheY-like chemotaxis protein
MKKILAVENDPSMRWLLRNLLCSRYEVVIKSNGMDAFASLSVQNIPDLIISEINMPVMDGLELLENLSISGLYKNIPVLMLSGAADHAMLKRSKELGAYTYLVKPFKPSDLLGKVAIPFVSEMFL